jgi:penicillin-binding protein 2
MLLSRNLSFAQISQIEERLDPLPGVEVEPESVRRYPGGTLACHVLGYLGEISEDELADGANQGYQIGDLVGRTGLESEYESMLRGYDGVAYTEVDALGRRTHLFPELPASPAIPGHDLLLTLDAGLQKVAEAALDAVPTKEKIAAAAAAKAAGVALADSALPGPPGALVAIDPRTGEILAMASRPPFDPNVFVRGQSKEDWRILNSPTHPLLNRAIQSSYPPGSVFKVVTSLAGLQEGVITAGRTFSACRGAYFFGNRSFHCWRKEGHGALALSDALTRSCDIYYYQLGIALGVARLGHFAEVLGVAKKTGIDLPQERAGLVPTPEWYHAHYGKGGTGPGAALNIAIGQGEDLLTPVEMARLAGAVAAGGRRMKPHLIRRVQSLNGEVLRDATQENWEDGTLPVSPENLEIVVSAMERVVMDNSGTGTRARVGPFRIAGKTGTAQNPHGDDHAVFICFATVDDPRIAVAVVVEGGGHGGSAAAPVAQRVLQAFLTGVVPSGEEPVAQWGAEGD